MKKDLEVHQTTAQVFYDRKSEELSGDPKCLVICLDYQKNLSLPNITTGEVYYKRQLSVFNLNIHELRRNYATFYVYPESIAKKGCNEVISFLDHYLHQANASEQYESVSIYLDSCAGQNKNYWMFLYLNFLVKYERKFKAITLHYPVRGHSYMECDRDMACINTKLVAYTVDDWKEIIRNARRNPTPYRVADVDQPMIKNWRGYLEPYFPKKCNFATQKIREIFFHTSEVKFRCSFNGPKTEVFLEKRGQERVDLNRNGLKPLYNKDIAITEEKWKDLQSLTKFCNAAGREMIDSLTHINMIEKESDFHDILFDDPDMELDDEFV